MLRKLVIVFVAGLVVALASTVPGFADPILFIKLEFSPLAYVQGSAHISTMAPHAHPLIPPGAVWNSPFVIGETGPNSVFLISPPPPGPPPDPTWHLLAPHGPPEMIPGPAFPYSLSVSVPQYGGIRDRRSRQVKAHGNHADLHVVALAAFSFLIPPNGELRGYVHGSMGTHVPQRAGVCRAAILGGDSEVPQTESTAVGALPLVVDVSQSTFTMLVVVVGITPSQLTAANIHLGAEGQTGPPIVDLGPPAMWQPLPEAKGMVRVIDRGSFPREFLEQLLSANTYVNLSTVRFPDGEIRGQIGPARAALEPLAQAHPAPDGPAKGSHRLLDWTAQVLHRSLVSLRQTLRVLLELDQRPPLKALSPNAARPRQPA